MIQNLVALTSHTPGLRTPHGQNAAFTRREMEKQQISGYSDGPGSAHCKTVGLAYAGSNPAPATTCHHLRKRPVSWVFVVSRAFLLLCRRVS